MQNSTLIKQNIQKLVLHHRKTIINKVAQKDLLREAFESNRLPKDLTEEQFLFMLSECLSEDGNFILENYKILTHPNPTPEMLDEGKLDVLYQGIKAIPGVVDDVWRWGKGLGGKIIGWVAEKVDGVWRWVWRGNGPAPDKLPTQSPGPKPGRIPNSLDDIPAPPEGNPIGPNKEFPNGIPNNEHGWPWDGPEVRPIPGAGQEPIVPSIWGESMSNFNHNMRHLMESNQQIDQNLLHSMLNQVNESKYLLELAIQRNQVNRIIDRI